MIVATSAVHGQGHPCHARGLHSVDYGFNEPLVHDPAAFAVETVVPVEPGRHDLVLGCIGQHVARQLLDRELVEGKVPVVGADEPFPPEPHGAATVALEPVAVGITGQIKPFQCHALAVVGRREQAVECLFIGLWGFVPGKGIHFRESGRESGQVQGGSS